MPVLIGVLAFAIDVSYALTEKNVMQGVADNAARAAARVKAANGSTQSMIYAEAKGVVDAHGSYTIDYVGTPQTGNYTYTTNAVEVRLSRPSTPFFSGALNLVTGQARVRAVAARDYMPCMMALKAAKDPGKDNSGITVSGNNTDLDAKCGIHSNYDVEGKSVVINAGKLWGNALSMRKWANDTWDTGLRIPPGRTSINQPIAENPFASRMTEMTTPRVGSPSMSFDTQCNTPYTAANGYGYNGATKTLYLKPGTYSSSISIGSSTTCAETAKYVETCKKDKGVTTCTTTSSPDITSTPTKIELESGIYYFGGNFDINYGAVTVVGERVTLVMTSDSSVFQMNGGSLTLSPSVSDSVYAGVLLVGRTNAEVTFKSNNANINMTGNVIMPNADLIMTGSVGSAAAGGVGKCLTLIAGGIKLSGITGTISGGCPSDQINFSNTRTFDLSE